MRVKIKSVKEVYQMAAVLFKCRVEELEKESLRLYLVRQLQHLKAEKFGIAKRYGICTSEEMEELYKKRELSEKDSWKDFFELDNIEAEIDKIEETLAEL